MSAEAQPMLSGLAEAAEALEQGRLEAAAALLGNLVHLSTRQTPAPPSLAESQLLLARQLFNRCQAAAARRQAELTASLSQSAVLRKASHAYGPGKR
jgi:hypothetical protein